MWVSPFRNLRIIGYLLLPEAYRSLSRLSSALSAKASALRSFLLGLSDTIALISDGLLVCCFSTSLLSQRLVSSLSLRLTYFRCFIYAVFKVHIDVSSFKNQKRCASLLAHAVMHFCNYWHVMP